MFVLSKRRKSKGKMKLISQLMASFLILCEGKKEQGTYTFDITDLFLFFTHCNVHDPEGDIRDRVLSSSKEGPHHKRNIYLCALIIRRKYHYSAKKQHHLFLFMLAEFTGI